VKVPVSVRLDPDVLEWLGHGQPGWQARLNAALRAARAANPGALFVVDVDPALLPRLDAYAARSGVDREAAMGELVTRGLDLVGASSSAAGVTPRAPGRQPAPSAPQASAANPRRTLVGYDPTTGAPIYRGGEQ
jgi:hypothetical protein